MASGSSPSHSPTSSYNAYNRDPPAYPGRNTGAVESGVVGPSRQAPAARGDAAGDGELSGTIGEVCPVTHTSR